MSLLWPLLAPGQRWEGAEVVALVQAGYHLEEMAPVVDRLVSGGFRATAVGLEPPAERWRRLRPHWRRWQETRRAAERVGLRPAGGPLEPDRVLTSATVLLTASDWGTSLPLVESAQRGGIPVVAKIEGVQDFDDLDTGRRRDPYRRADMVLGNGPADAEHLLVRDVQVVGNVRLERLRSGPAAHRSGLTVVNTNFTYGVLTEHRQPWLQSVTAAARDAGVRFVVSRHAAERGWVDPRLVTRERAARLLRRADRLVTRFSTLVLEALALGVEVIYHNPHRERSIHYLEPRGAFPVTTTTERLTAALRRPVASPEEVRARAAAFLDHHVDVRPGRPAVARTAEAVVSAMRR